MQNLCKIPHDEAAAIRAVYPDWKFWVSYYWNQFYSHGNVTGFLGVFSGNGFQSEKFLFNSGPHRNIVRYIGIFILKIWIAMVLADFSGNRKIVKHNIIYS